MSSADAPAATQAVVEKRLRASGELKGPLRESMTRDAFVASGVTITTSSGEVTLRVAPPPEPPPALPARG